MKLFTVSFEGWWLEGYAVVWNTTKRKALNDINKHLKDSIDYTINMDDLTEIDLSKPGNTLLSIGDC